VVKYPPFLFIFVIMNKALEMLRSDDTDVILLGCNILYNFGCGIHYINEVCPIKVEVLNKQVVRKKQLRGCKCCNKR
jgi:hypothetical protein